MKAIIYGKQFRSRVFLYLKQHYGFSDIFKIGNDALLIGTNDSSDADSKIFHKLLADPVLQGNAIHIFCNQRVLRFWYLE